MTSKWVYILGERAKQLWFRTSLYCALAILTALMSATLSDLVPKPLRDFVSFEAVQMILEILASSMLVVATFSLTNIMQAINSAATTATPRATQLLTEDAAAQNALAAFIGAFLFSIVGLFALSAGVYGDKGDTSSGEIVTLFASTVIVVILVIVMLLRWIEQLSRLGRVEESIDLVESATRDALKKRANNPCLGGRPLGKIPEPRFPVICNTIGYVQYIDMDTLQTIAREQQTQIYITVLPGSFCDLIRPIAFTSTAVDDKVITAICAALVVGGNRTFHQDPRFGLVVLAEIAIRALSPGINDPGTAIDVIGTGVRLFHLWAQTREQAMQAFEREPSGGPPIAYDRIWVKQLQESDFFEDLYSGIARDGAGISEVCIRLQKALRAIGTMDFPAYVEPARQWSAEVLERCETQLTRAEYRRLQAIADSTKKFE